MDRDWKAEWAEVEAEFHAAKASLDEAHKAVSPEVVISGRPMKSASAEDFEIYAAATQRFEAATAHRREFMAERRAFDPAWNGSA